MALTEVGIRKAKPQEKAYMMSDGAGLYLSITPSGGKLWRWGYRFDRREKLMALGKYPDTLKQIQFEVSELVLSDPSIVLVSSGGPLVSPPPPTTSDQAWNLIQKDFTLRLSLAVEDMHAQLKKDISELEVETHKRGNAAYYVPARIELEIKRLDSCAEWYYGICREIWRIQGRQESRVFYRAVFEHCLTPMFAVSSSTTANELQMRDVRIGRRGASVAGLAEMSRQVQRLAARWNTKLEIAARDHEHRQQIARQYAPHQPRQVTIHPDKPVATANRYKPSQSRREARRQERKLDTSAGNKSFSLLNERIRRNRTRGLREKLLLAN